MPYWFIVTRSFRIAWSYKYLWLLALFSGESSAGFNFSYSQPAGGRSGAPPNFADAQAQINTWIVQHEGLIAALVVASFILFIALFVLAAACEGALVRGAAEHDAERPFGLGWAWQAGRMTLWTIVRFRLLLIALVLPAIVVLLILIAGFILATTSQNAVAAVLIGLVTLVFFLGVFVYAIYLSFLDRLGTRVLVLEQVMARAAIARAHRLLFKRLGRVLLVWLLSIGVSIAVGIVVGIALTVVALPAIVAVVVMVSGGPAAWWVIVLDLLVVIPVALAVGGFVGAQGSTYWTLSFRRLDIDQT